MRAVLDTNVVMSAIFFGGVPFDVLNAWHDGEFELVVSDAVMEEYREIAARMKAKFPSIEPERWMRYIEEHATVVPAVPLVAQVCEDADDDVFLACAVTANAKDVCGRLRGDSRPRWSAALPGLWSVQAGGVRESTMSATRAAASGVAIARIFSARASSDSGCSILWSIQFAMARGVSES